MRVHQPVARNAALSLYDKRGEESMGGPESDPYSEGDEAEYWRGMYAAAQPVESTQHSAQQANHDICPYHDVVECIRQGKIEYRFHTCLCKGKRS